MWYICSKEYPVFKKVNMNMRPYHIQVQLYKLQLYILILNILYTNIMYVILTIFAVNLFLNIKYKIKGIYSYKPLRVNIRVVWLVVVGSFFI